MAEGVVDLLETIDINHEQGEGFLGGFGGFNRFPEFQVEKTFGVQLCKVVGSH